MSLPYELYVRVFSRLHLRDFFNQRLISNFSNEVIQKIQYNKLIFIPSLSNNKISDNIVNLKIRSSIAGLKIINNLINIKSLNLTYYKNITDADIFDLRKLKKLEIINLNVSLIADIGVNSLRRIKKLRILNLSSTNITDHSTIYIAQMKNLEELDISFTDITVEGIRHLQKNNSLSKLIFCNIIDDCSTDDFHRIKKIKSLTITPYNDDIEFGQLTNLDELILQDISLNQNMLNKIGKLIKLKRLVLSCATFNSNIIFDLNFPKLEELEITVSSVTNYKIHLVPDGIQTITSLNIDACEINEDDIKSLIKCRNLKNLTINDTLNQVPKLDFVKELTTLKSFTTFDFLSEDKISEICNSSSIKKLHIEMMFDEDMKHLQRLKQLRKIFFSINHNITDQGLFYLKNCKSLEEIKISMNNNITNQGIRYLYRLKNLRKLTLNNCSKIKFDELEFNSSVKVH